MVVRLYRK